MQKGIRKCDAKSAFSNHCFVLMHLFRNSFFFFHFYYFLSFKPRTLRYSTAARALAAQWAMVVTVGSLALLPGPAVEQDLPRGSLTSPTGTLCWPGCWRTASEATPEPSWLPVSRLPELVLCWDWCSATAAHFIKGLRQPGRRQQGQWSWAGLERLGVCFNLLLLPQPCLLHTLATVRPWARWDMHPTPKTSSTSHG